MYNEDDFLQISGLQHFSFCKRQWALIYIEELWKENFLSMDGHIMHERAHDEGFNESRGSVFISRGMPVHSFVLGLSGECDIVEFHKDENGVQIVGRDGKFLPLPVEYKRGHSKANDCDRLQLCAQGMCLEEMLCCTIATGCIYYGETKRREYVKLDEYKSKVAQMVKEMHDCFERCYTPVVKPSKSCKACSLGELCLPEISAKGNVEDYLSERLKEIL